MTVRVTSKKKSDIPNDLVTRCPSCSEIIFNKDIEKNLKTCPKCEHHFYMTPQERVKMLSDSGELIEQLSGSIKASDPLEFEGYQEKLAKGQKKTGLQDAILTGICEIGGTRTALAVTDFSFMGGSMGSVMGEEIARLVERAITDLLPVVIVSASGGGARMQEGIISLMQMAKTSAALARLAEKKLPYIAVLTNPTGGGVTASYAMLGDIIMAEPNALIMFAGPRVIEQTIRQHLPKRFQRAEFLLEHGMLDMIVKRASMKETIGRILKIKSPVASK